MIETVTVNIGRGYMELEFEHRIKISDTDILSGVHFQNNEAQFYNIANARLYGQTSFTNNGVWYYWDEITQSLYDPNFNKDGLLLKNKDIELINMSHIPRSGVYAVCKENPLNNKHVFYGLYRELWSPRSSMGKS